MLGLSQDKWTVIGRSSKPGTWHYIEGYDEKLVIDAAFSDRIIVMHRRYIEGDIRGWHLVARLPGPAWMKFQKRRGLV